MMKQFNVSLQVSTCGRGLMDVTEKVVSWTRSKGITDGLLTIFIQHTSASLIIQENADNDVLKDMEGFFKKLVMDGDPDFFHIMEGPDDMSAHIRSALTQTQLSIPVIAGSPVLGTWQGIYVYEHRTRPHNRTVVLHLLGE